MARGTPDGKIADFRYASQATDLASVYSMLWGFSPIDGQGRVMYFDTFNNGLGGWKTSTTGAAVAPLLAIPQQMTFSPPNAVFFSPGITNGDQAQIYREMYFGKSLRLGIECGYGAPFTAGSKCANPRLTLDYNPTAFSPWFGGLTFNAAAGEWRVLTGTSGTPTETAFFTAGTPSTTMGLLIQIKVVMDFSTGKYVRAFIGDQDFDLSAYSMRTSSSSYNGWAIAAFKGISHGATTLSFWLGYMLITRDEP